jgi:regulator of replication initiation timing
MASGKKPLLDLVTSYKERIRMLETELGAARETATKHVQENVSLRAKVEALRSDLEISDEDRQLSRGNLFEALKQRDEANDRVDELEGFIDFAIEGVARAVLKNRD